jgi:hypothetical protein
MCLTTSSLVQLGQINLIGDYVWSSGDEATENHDRF